MERLDDILLTRVFTPIAHAVDYWLHTNNYALAGCCFHAAAALFVCDYALHISRIGFWSYGFFGHFQMVVWLLWQMFMVKKCNRARDSYENRPDVLPADAQMFMLMSPRSRFLLFCFVTIILSSLDGIVVIERNEGFVLATVEFVVRSFMVPYVIGLYFGAVPKPPARRHERRMRNLAHSPA